MLIETAEIEPANGVSVLLSLFGMELYADPGVGISTENLDYHIPKKEDVWYSLMKAEV